MFNKVSPYTYTKNKVIFDIIYCFILLVKWKIWNFFYKKRGYTIIAESREQPVTSGRWRLRLIGSSPALIAPKDNKTEIVSSFETKESRDYYQPNENKTIMR